MVLHFTLVKAYADLKDADRFISSYRGRQSTQIGNKRANDERGTLLLLIAASFAMRLAMIS